MLEYKEKEGDCSFRIFGLVFRKLESQFSDKIRDFEKIGRGGETSWDEEEDQN